MNPELYLKFNNERIQPSIDLVSKIEIKDPKKIIDIGCGPGNSTQILRQRWPGSSILGIDKSETMISRAFSDFPNQEWKLFDVETDPFQDTFDLVYSNATIQWIHHHDILLENLSAILNPNGVLAIQVPLFFDMPLGKSIYRVANHPKWAPFTKDAHQLYTSLNGCEYYDILSNLFRRVDMWKTDYIHIMDSHNSILEMVRSTGLRPYLNKITGTDERSQFEEMVLQSIQSDYPSQKNGRVLFPFKRLFFVGYK